MENYPEAAVATAGQASLIGAYNPTVEENIDEKIKRLKSEITRLEKLKATLPEGLLRCNIGDLRTAMHI